MSAKYKFMPSDRLVQQVLERAVEIQQIPAPTFQEERRAAFLQAQFAQEGLLDVAIDRAMNVYGRLPGRGEASPLVVSAHTDTVFPASTALTIKRQEGVLAGPGIGDNSLGVAGLFGLLWGLRQNNIELPGDVWLVGNSGEEGLGDLKGMKAVVERFGAEPMAYIVLEGMALGQVYYHGISVERYQITVNTQGGHSWVDYGSPSAIHRLAGLIERIAALKLASNPRTTLNVGKVSGGTSINTIAAWATCELDLRSENASSLSALVGQVTNLVHETARPDIQVRMEKIGQRPGGGISPRHPLVTLAVQNLRQVGITAHLNSGSTDANIPFSRGLPAICLGLTHGGRGHTEDEFIYTAPVVKGLAQLLGVVAGAFNR